MKILPYWKHCIDVPVRTEIAVRRCDGEFPEPATLGYSLRKCAPAGLFSVAFPIFQAALPHRNWTNVHVFPERGLLKGVDKNRLPAFVDRNYFPAELHPKMPADRKVR